MGLSSFVPISRARISPLDLLLLLIMWLAVYAASIRNFGYAPAIIFYSINVILLLRNSVNGILVLILIFYSPTVALGIGNTFVISFLLAFIRYLFADSWRNFMNPAHRFILLSTSFFVIYLTVTLLYAPDLDNSIEYYRKYLEGLALLSLFLAQVNSKEKLGQMLKWWALVSGLAIIFKLTHQYLGSETYLYKIMEHQVRRDFTLDERLTINVGGYLAKRLLMPGEEPNYTSAGLIFPFASAIGFFFAAKVRSKPIWVAIATVIGISIIGTYSRSGFLAIALVLALLVLRSHLRAIIPVSVVGGAAYVLIMETKQLHDRIFGIGQSIHKGASGRFFLWQKATENWLESPAWGKGFGFFYYKYHDAAHSSYMQLLVETGVVGLLLFASIIVISILSGSRVKRMDGTSDDPDFPFSRVIIIGLIGASFMIGTVTYQDIKLFWLACGACAAMPVVTNMDMLKIQKR